MPSALERFLVKLQRRRRFSPEEASAILSLNGQVMTVADGFSGAGTTQAICIVKDGIASRIENLAQRDALCAFGLPGDAINLRSLLLKQGHEAVRLHGRASVFCVCRTDILKTARTFPRIAEALWQDALVDGSIAQTWMAVNSNLPALNRVAHRMLEFATRYSAIGELKDQTFIVPLTQKTIADSLGLSLVHYNKNLSRLRKAGFLNYNDNRITLLGASNLRELAGFDERYLHLGEQELLGTGGGTSECAVKMESVSGVHDTEILKAQALQPFKSLLDNELISKRVRAPCSNEDPPN